MSPGVLDAQDNFLTGFFDRFKKSSFFEKCEPIFDAMCPCVNQFHHKTTMYVFQTYLSHEFIFFYHTRPGVANSFNFLT